MTPAQKIQLREKRNRMSPMGAARRSKASLNPIKVTTSHMRLRVVGTLKASNSRAPLQEAPKRVRMSKATLGSISRTPKEVPRSESRVTTG